MSDRIPITIVAGAQWGSESKGAIAGWLAVVRDVDYAVRTGSINAGHTVYYEGKAYAMQQLPTAWVNPNAALVIGPGAYVHAPTLLREIDMIKQATGEDPSSRIFIDYRAGIHVDSYAQESRDVNRHHLIGATGKGCAEAIVHKIQDRGKASLLFKDVYEANFGNAPWYYVDVPAKLTNAYDRGASILLEGTQGELLDFHLGPWPYVTSRQTTAAAWVTEAGLSPMLAYELVLVARTYPIRVAGNSGPMPGETSWPVLARQIRVRLEGQGHATADHPLWVSEDAIQAYERAVQVVGDARGIGNLGYNFVWTPEGRVKYRDVLSEYAWIAMDMLSDVHQAQVRKLFEFTTVTKKLRRIARADREGLQRTIAILQPSWVALTFLNYEFPELHGQVRLSAEAEAYARSFCPRVTVATTGPLPEHVLMDSAWLG